MKKVVTVALLLGLGLAGACGGRGMSVADCEAQCKPRDMCSFSDDENGKGFCVCEDSIGNCPPGSDDGGAP